MLLLKVCGMRDPRNVKDLIKLSPDFMGFIFHEESPRNVTETLEQTIPKNIKKVGVFVDKEEVFIKKIAVNFDLDYLQLHGKETPKKCQKLRNEGFKIIKAFNISENFDFQKLKEYESFCDYFLFDAFGKNAGGNGITFNWELLHKYNGDTPFWLSGGIDDTMIDSLKKIRHPMFSGVDINSGFETRAAFKDINKIEKFKKGL